MRILELEEFVAVLPRMTGAAPSQLMSCRGHKKKNHTSICGRCERHRTKRREAKAKVT